MQTISRSLATNAFSTVTPDLVKILPDGSGLTMYCVEKVFVCQLEKQKKKMYVPFN